MGHVSLLMIPVYSFAYLITGPAVVRLRRWGLMHVLVRTPVIVVIIYAIEWSSGAAYHAAGLNPWYYDHGWASAFSGGNITLYYLPAWVVFAIVVLPVYGVVQACVEVVAAGRNQGFSASLSGLSGAG